MKNVAFYSLVLILVVAPLLLGGARPMTTAPLLVAVFLVFAFQIVFCAEEFRKNVIFTAAPMLIGISVVCIWSFVQTFFFSLDAHASFHDGLVTLAYLCFFLLLITAIDSRKKLEVVVWVLVCCGVIQVLVKLVTNAPGTFVNYNHFAAYLEMTVALAIGLMIARLENKSDRSWREVARGWLTVMLGPKVIVRVLIVILIIGLILSKSRMGNTAFFGSLFICAFIGLLAFRRLNRSVLYFFGSILVLDVVLMGALFGIDKLQSRFEQLNLSENVRVVSNETNLQLIADHWQTGVGLGAFYTAYPAYRDERMIGLLRDAHNDLMQFPAELGIPIALMLFGGVLHSLFFAIRVQFLRRSQFMKAMGFAAAMATISISIHASAEFNLQRTSNTLTFLTLLALPYLAWNLDRQRKEGTSG